LGETLYFKAFNDKSYSTSVISYSVMTTAFYPQFCNASIHYPLDTLPEKPPHALSHIAFHV